MLIQVLHEIDFKMELNMQFLLGEMPVTEK